MLSGQDSLQGEVKAKIVLNDNVGTIAAGQKVQVSSSQIPTRTVNVRT
jgi:flagellar basal body P-ring protein FlgI